jgi:hypothetical protein
MRAASKQAIRTEQTSTQATVPRETARDLEPTGFTPILRRLLAASSHVLGVAFVDHEGECVDYCSAIDPYDTKVAGAHWQMVAADIAARLGPLGHGAPRLVHVAGRSRDFVIASLSVEYTLVVVAEAGAVVRAVLDAVERALEELRAEAGLGPGAPADPEALRVETRPARGWAYAPAAFTRAGRPVAIAAVLGRWVEGGAVTGGDLVCFRVRTDTGEELTLAHEVGADEWSVR